MPTLSLRILGCGSSGGVPRVGYGWGACDPADPRNRRRRCSLLVERRQGDPAARWRTHARLLGTGHHLLMLFGASGFLACAPAADLHLAAGTGNVYLHPGAEGGTDD